MAWAVEGTSKCARASKGKEAEKGGTVVESKCENHACKQAPISCVQLMKKSACDQSCAHVTPVRFKQPSGMT